MVRNVQISDCLTVNTSDWWDMIIIEGQSWSSWSHFLEKGPQNIWSGVTRKEMQRFLFRLTCCHVWNVLLMLQYACLKTSHTCTAGLEEGRSNDCYTIGLNLCCMVSLEEGQRKMGNEWIINYLKKRKETPLDINNKANYYLWHLDILNRFIITTINAIAW